MNVSISHDFEEESLEAKTEWFLQKTIQERLAEAFADMEFVTQLNPNLPDDHSTFKTIRILEPKQG